MPRANAKDLSSATEEIRCAYEKAFANPGATVVVATDVTVGMGKNLHARLAAVRLGFTKFYPSDHEYHRAAMAKRLHINQEYDRASPLLRTVTLRYEGMLKRPSEIVEEFKQLYYAGKRDLPY